MNKTDDNVYRTKINWAMMSQVLAIMIWTISVREYIDTMTSPSSYDCAFCTTGKKHILQVKDKIVTYVRINLIYDI